MVSPPRLPALTSSLQPEEHVTIAPPPRTGTVSVTKAAHILGVHPNTVRAWTDQGRLRCLRINARGDRRYRLEDLDAFLADAARGSRLARAPTAAARIDRRADAATAGADATAGTASLERLGTTSGAPPDRRQALQAPWRGSRGPNAARRDVEIDVLTSISRLSASVSDFDSTLSAIARLLREAFGYRIVSFGELRDELLWLRVAAGLDVTRIPPIGRDQGLSGASLIERHAILAPDVREEPRYIANLPEVRSEIAVPIFMGDEPWGVLVADDDRADALIDEDLDLLEAVANQVAVAARNVQLVAKIQRQLEQAEALRRIGADITSKLDLHIILSDLIDHATVLFGADRAAVYLRQPDGTYIAPVARGLSERYLSFVRSFPTPSLAASVLQLGRALAANDYAHDPRSAGVREAVVQEGFDTVAMAPLVAAEETLGVLALYHDRRRPWDEDDLDVLDALAVQASIAIANARNYAQTATWAAQLQSIQQLGARLTRLSTVRDVGLAICTELHQLIDYHNVRVYRVEGDVLEPVAWHGEIGEYKDEAEEQLRLDVGQGITGWVALHGVAQNLPDASADPRSRTIPGTEEDLDESLLVAPMKHEDRVLGVIVLSKLGLHQFSQDDLRLIEIYGSIAAQAVSNAIATERLQAQSAALERRVRSQQELLRMTEAILGTLDPSAVLDHVAERLGALVEVDTIAIDLHDPGSDRLRPFIARGTSAERYLAQAPAHDEGVAGWVVQHGEALLVPDVQTDPRVGRRDPSGQAGSLIVVPLRGRDRTVGVLTLERLGEGRTFSDEEFELVQLFAAQASVALQNAQAHRAVEVRAQTDGLTGLSNHATFQEHLARAALRPEPFGLLMIDLDEFKGYNDAFGHQAGDAMLRRIADALVAACRETDRVFRYGGDEFTILLPGAELHGGLKVADKVRAAVRQVSRANGGNTHPLTCSVGVAIFPGDGAAADAVLFAADRACYLSKRVGRDRVSTAAEGAERAAGFLPTPPTPVDEPSLEAVPPDG